VKIPIVFFQQTDKLGNTEAFVCVCVCVWQCCISMRYCISWMHWCRKNDFRFRSV